MSEDAVPYSVAPSRVFLHGRQVEAAAGGWTPPEATMTPMKVNGAPLDASSGEERPETAGEIQYGDECVARAANLDRLQVPGYRTPAEWADMQEQEDLFAAQESARVQLGKLFLSDLEKAVIRRDLKRQQAQRRR